MTKVIKVTKIVIKVFAILAVVRESSGYRDISTFKVLAISQVMGSTFFTDCPLPKKSWQVGLRNETQQ